MPEDRIKALIERELDRQGLTAVSWRQDEDYTEPRAEAVLGRFRVTDGDEDAGLYSGSEGELRAGVVGTPEYRNERVSFAFHEDGMEGGIDVRDLDLLESVD